MDNKELDKLMCDKFIPPASSNLSSRIIDAARPAKVKQPLMDKISESFGRFLTIPKPALAIASVAILGLFIYGTMEPYQLTPEHQQNSEVIITVDELWTYVTDDDGNFL